MATREQVCRVRLDLSRGASPEVVTETLAKVAGLAVGLCVEHGVGLVAMDWRAHPRAARLNGSRPRAGWRRTSCHSHALQRCRAYGRIRK